MGKSSEVAKRGVLYPDLLPTNFNRQGAEGPVSALVQWWWTSEWSLSPDEKSRQVLLPFPASNLVVEGGERARSHVRLHGPATRSSVRELAGSGWAVAALLQPAAIPLFSSNPTNLRDNFVQLSAESLLDGVTLAMNSNESLRARAVLETWLEAKLPSVTSEGLLANQLARLINEDSSITSVTDVAEKLSLSERSIHRLTQTYVGLTPYAMITRRRLQESADRIRSHPDVTLTEIAYEFGFTDQAHFTKVFNEHLGQTPSEYRKSAALNVAQNSH